MDTKIIKKVELLSPAGDMECLKYAIKNGADAVYLGLKNYSARASAINFSHEELIEAINYAHLYGVKIYVTLNTLYNEDEIKSVIKEVEFLHSINVDAIIIQDLGLYYYLYNNYKDFEIHASTQMHVQNINALDNAIKLGFKRVVIPRESDIKFIQEACKKNIEIECFIHGANCVSYSGQCLMSSMSCNRSANKGACSQMCRHKYKLYKDNKQIQTETDYLISPKDNCYINDIEMLIKAGVSSFKIEGRLKSKYYVGYITRCYRQAIDAYYNNQKFNIDSEIMNNIKVLYNRDFTNTYLKNNDDDIFLQKSPNHKGIKLGQIVYVKDGFITIKLERDLYQFDSIRVLTKYDEFGFVCNKLYKNRLLVNKALKGENVSVSYDLKYKPKVNDIVYLTNSYNLANQIDAYDFYRKLPLNINIKLTSNTIEIEENNYYFKKSYLINIQYSNNNYDLQSSFIKQFSKLNDTCYKLNCLKFNSDSSYFLQVSIINELRRQFISDLNSFRLSNFKRMLNNYNFKITKRYHIYENIIEENNYLTCGKDKYTLNPVINPNSKYLNDDYQVISEFGNLLIDIKHKIAYYTLNITNSYAVNFFKDLGFEAIIVSIELKQIYIESILKNVDNDIKLHVFDKGEVSLMHIKKDPFKKYVNNYENITICDNINTFKVKKGINDIQIKKQYNNQITFNDRIIPFVVK